VLLLRSSRGKAIGGVSVGEVALEGLRAGVDDSANDSCDFEIHGNDRKRNQAIEAIRQIS